MQGRHPGLGRLTEPVAEVQEQDLITALERNHSLRSGKMPFSSTIPSIIAPVSPLASVWTTMTPP
jgi:hypothetical protein